LNFNLFRFFEWVLNSTFVLKKSSHTHIKKRGQNSKSSAVWFSTTNPLNKMSKAHAKRRERHRFTLSGLWNCRDSTAKI